MAVHAFQWAMVPVAAQGGGGESGTTYNAATASRTDVLAAIALTSPGDTVVVPANAGVSWSGGITISGITLRGPGKDAGSPCVVTAGGVSINKHATHTTRLSGFKFTGANRQVTTGGTRSQKLYFIDDCDFAISSTGVIWLSNGGVFYGNAVHGNPADGDCFQVVGFDGYAAYPNNEWSQDDTIGTRDTNGDANCYIEGNTFTNVLETCPDGDSSARLVIRYNTYTDSSIVFHSTSPNDSGDYGGTRHFEIYNNTFIRIDAGASTQPMWKWIWVRGATGVILDNDFDPVSTSEYPGKTEIRLSVGCSASSYPVQFQPGQYSSTRETSPSKPIALAGNSGTYVVAPYDGSLVSCGDPSSYLQSGRDWVTSQTWSYTKYTYPHPARPT